MLKCPVPFFQKVEDIPVELHKGNLYKHDNISGLIKDYMIKSITNGYS